MLILILVLVAAWIVFGIGAVGLTFDFFQTLDEQFEAMGFPGWTAKQKRGHQWFSWWWGLSGGPVSFFIAFSENHYTLRGWRIK